MIQIFDYGHTPDGVFYYAMEYLDGLNLADLTARYGIQSEERIIHILRQVCDALNEAHGMGLIHRDIKPANIFLSDRGGVPDCVKVLDFGLVKHVGTGARQKVQTERRPGEKIVGTPNFIAPEAIEDPDKADARSDLYSVGTVAYYLMTGRHVFEGDSIAAVSRRHLTETPEAPGARIGISFDAQFEALIMRCLDKDPSARPQSARELGEALAACPPATRWNLARRAAWWQAHRDASARSGTEKRPPSAGMAKTVRIDLEERRA
jgi:serine/threonine-protein kinase